ncbi:family 10 glycosylhydrolase [Candidatus Aquicultor sp.]
MISLVLTLSTGTNKLPVDRETAKPVRKEPFNGKTLSGAWYPSYLARPNWEQKFTKLKANGINAYFADSGSIGRSFYPSKLTPNADAYLDRMIPAANAKGIQVFLWHQDMFFGNADATAGYAVNEKLKAEDRLMRRSDGTPIDYWIDPANDANRRLDIQVILEKLDRYHEDIAGLNLDYIRYPDIDSSYTTAARKKFEARYGPVKRWPADVKHGGVRHKQYSQLQRDIITSHVRDIYTTVKEKYPRLLVTVDVWPDYRSARDNQYQDWPAWKDSVDVFIPMTYTDPAANPWFERMTAQNIKLASPKPLWVGVGTRGVPDERPNPASNMAGQIRYTLSRGAQGFVIFSDN